MARNIGNVVNSINELVAELGLEKLSAADDPGTSHPAKQEDGKANIQSATEGARSAENTSDNKSEVTGQSIAEAKPADAKKDKAESSASNITTASFVGEAPKVEQGYSSKVTDPGTTHPAKADEKTAQDLGKCAEAVLAELKKIAEATVSNAADARTKIASLVEAPADKKEAVIDEHVTEYLKGYTKSAALVGELTADMLDGMAAALVQKEKKAEGEAAPEGGAVIPPEAMGGGAPGGAPAGAEGGAGGVDEEAAALAQAAAEIAAELGVTPEEVLQAAEAELAQQGGGAEGGAPAGGPPAGAEPSMEVAASVKELTELRAKAAELDALKAKQAADEAAEKQATVVKTAVTSALEKFMAERKETK